MDIRIIHETRPEMEDDARERRRHRQDIQIIKELLMALSAQVAAVLEQARKLDNVVDAMNAGFKALQDQVTSLKDQIVNQSPSLSEEDKTALAEAASEIQENIARMPQNIVAGTGQTGTDGGAGEVAPAEPVENDPAPPTPVEELELPPVEVAPGEISPAGGVQGENTQPDPNAPTTNPNG